MICQYCSGEKPIFEKSDYDYNSVDELSYIDLEIGIKDGKLSYQIDGFGADDIDITYCPFCGKQLTKNNVK